MDNPFHLLMSEGKCQCLAILGFIFVFKVVRCLVNDITWLITTYAPALYRPYNYLHKYGDWAAITGCTAGIGLAFAKEMARRGTNLVLIGRDQNKLTKLAKEIENESKIQTKCIIFDASDRGSIMRMVKELSTLDIGILFNNVGVHSEGSKQAVIEMSMESIYSMITINTGVASMTIKHVLPDMIKAGRGVVVNVCSSSSFTPVPLQALYGATKIYLDLLSRTLGHEIASRGVKIQSICPLLVQSNMTSKASPIIHNIFSITGQNFAESAINKIATCKRTAGYWLFDLVIGLSVNILNETFVLYGLYYIIAFLKEKKS